MRMSEALTGPSDDPAIPKAMIAALQAENDQMSTTLRTHDLLQAPLGGCMHSPAGNG